MVRKFDETGVKLWILLGYDPKDGTNTGSKRVPLQARAGLNVAAKLTLSASYLSYHYDSTHMFVLHGSDFIVKLPVDLALSATKHCVQAGSTTVLNIDDNGFTGRGNKDITTDPSTPGKEGFTAIDMVNDVSASPLGVTVNTS